MVLPRAPDDFLLLLFVLGIVCVESLCFEIVCSLTFEDSCCTEFAFGVAVDTFYKDINTITLVKWR